MLALNPLKEMIEHAKTSVVTEGGHTTVFEPYESRTVSFITGRQSGSTTRVLDVFDPTTDLYVSTHHLLIKSFQERLGSRCRYLNLRARDFSRVLKLMSEQPIKHVFIDVGGVGLFEHRNRIEHFIRVFDETSEAPIKPIYIIT